MKTFILTVILLYTHFAFTTENEDRIKLIYVKGIVQLNDGKNNFVDLKKDEEIYEGDEIITGKDSFAVLRMLDNSIIKIEPLSSFVIETVAPVVNKKSYGITTTLLRKGRAFFEINNQDKQEVLNVKTKTVSMAVRGTNFLVDTEKEDVWVGVKEGEVEVKDPRDSNKREVVLPGEGMKIERGRKFTKPKAYQWLKSVRFKNTDFNIVDSGFRGLRDKRRSEFQNKKENWKFNPQRYQKRKKLWDERKAKFRSKNKDMLNNLRTRTKSFRSSQANGKKQRDGRFGKIIQNKRKIRRKRLNQFKKRDRKINIPRGGKMQDRIRNRKRNRR